MLLSRLNNVYAVLGYEIEQQEKGDEHAIKEELKILGMSIVSNCKIPLTLAIYLQWLRTLLCILRIILYVH